MNIQAWWIALRPKTLIVSIAPVLLGISLAIYDYELNNILVGILTLISAIMIQIGTNFINDLYDFLKGADDYKRLGPIRATQSGLLSQKEIKFGAFISFLIAFLIGIYLVNVGGMPILIIGTLSLLCGYCYTAGPYPLGYNGLGDIFVFIFFGLIAVPGTYYLQSGILFDIDSIIIGSSVGFIAVAILCVNNIRDIESDKIVGKKTLAVRFGIKPIIILYHLMIIFSYISIIILFFKWESPFGLYLVLLSIPVAIKLMLDINKKTGKALNYLLADTALFMRLFSILLVIGLLV